MKDDNINQLTDEKAMSTYTFHLDDDLCMPRVITRGGLLNPALIEELTENRDGLDPFDLFSTEEEIIKDVITTAILEPYHSVRHCLAPIERFEFEFSDIDDVGGMVTVTATGVYANGMHHTITVRTNSASPNWKAFYKLFWLRSPNINSHIKTVYHGVGGDGRVKLHPYVMCETRLPTADQIARLHSPSWRIQEFDGVVTAGLMVTGMFFVKTKFFGLYNAAVIIGDSSLVNVEAPVDFLSDGVKRDIEQLEKILRKPTN